MIYNREYTDYCKENKNFKYEDIYYWLLLRFENNIILEKELDDIFTENSCNIEYIRMFNKLFIGYYIYEYKNSYSLMIIMLKMIEKKMMKI